MCGTEIYCSALVIENIALLSNFVMLTMRTLSFVEESLSPRRLEMIMIMVRMVMAVAGLRVELLDPLRHCWVDNAWRGG